MDLAAVSTFELLLATHLAPGMPHLVLPGCWDGLSARLIEGRGYSAAWIGREALAISRFGRDERPLITLTMLAAVVSDIRDSTALALAVDAGDGFGNAFNVGRAVAVLEMAGAQAMQLEDEFQSGSVTDPKRATADMIGKVKAAGDAAQSLLLIARAGRLKREPLSALMDRISAYAEAGADLIGVGGPLTASELVKLAEWAKARVPLMIESDAPYDAARFPERTVICQPTLLQRGMEAAAQAILVPPATVPRPEPETLRELES